MEQARRVWARHGLLGLAARVGLRLLAPATRDAADWKGPLVPLAAAGEQDERGPQATIRAVAAVFVAFFPDSDFGRRVAVTGEQVDRIYVVDNTPAGGPPGGARAEAKDAAAGGVAATAAHAGAAADIEVIRNGRNMGVATALNQGVTRAIADGYGFLLMMDQDSVPRPGMVEALLSALRHWPACAAIASPLHLDPNLAQQPVSFSPRRPGEQGRARSMLATMTAGSLLDLRAYQALGPFRDDLFIDQVDHEYCLRAHRNGFDVIEVQDASIDHTLGQRSTRHVAGLAIVTSNHSSLRRYYITRNRLIVAREYPDFPAYRRTGRAQTLVELRNALLFEDRKMAKLGMAARGFWDYRRHQTGPLPESQAGR